jgi:putative ABC transport system substrate-binding protein
MAAEAQAPANTVRIGWLGLAAPTPEVLRVVNAFKNGLRELGYVDGQNLAFEYRWAHGQSDRLRPLVAELIRLKVDVIAAGNPNRSPWQRRDEHHSHRGHRARAPVARPRRESRAPGGNVTGVSLIAGPEIGGKCLELLTEAVPRVSRVALLIRADHPGHAAWVKEGPGGGPAGKVTIQTVKARTPQDLESAFAEMRRGRAEALVVLADAVFFQHRTRIADLAAKGRLPTIYGMTEHAEAGGLMAYAANFEGSGTARGEPRGQDPQGRQPRGSAVERPTRFGLTINARTAKALGLTMPRSLLSRAERVIE